MAAESRSAGAPDAAELSTGELVGTRYRIAALIGRGGMGAVYRARDEVEDRDVAVKLLHPRLFEHQRALRTRHEFHAMVRLRHPRLVDVYDYGLLPAGAPYFVMELLGGTDLAAAGRLPVPVACRVLAAVADALAFMHARGYVHRDVKPANVRMVRGRASDDVEVKLMDFGAVELTGGGAGVIAGTVPYLAPESHYGVAVDPRVDLYALGVVAYEITAGRYPFPGRTSADLLTAKLAPCPPLDSERDDIPAALARLVDDLLAPEPSARPSNGREVVARLAEIAGDDLGVQTTLSAHLRTPALSGRDAELMAVRAQLSAAASGRPRAALVVAPAGAGKTRLWEEALLEVRMGNVRVAKVSCHGHAGSPYEALRALMRTLLREPGADAALQAAGGVAALGAIHPNRVTRPGRHSRDPVSEREAMHAAFVAFVRALCSERAVVVGVDDIHLADSASIDALAAVLRAGTGARFGIAATIREGEPLPPALQQLLALEAATEIALAPLGADKVRELLRTTLGPGDASEALLADIVHASAGNVYFVLEIVRRMLARGAIARTHTGAVFPDRLADSDVPASLAEALVARLDALSADARRVATTIAVFEHATDLDALAAVVGGDPDRFLDALRELQEAEFVDFDDGIARAHHPRVREVLVAALDEPTRRALHARVARVLAAAGADDAILAVHYLGAGNRQRALECFIRAGDARYDALAFFDAGSAYRQALDLIDAAPRPRRAELECMLCDRLGRIGLMADHAGAIEYLTRARALYLRQGLLRAVPHLGPLVGPLPAVAAAVGGTGLWNLFRRRRRPFQRTVQALRDAFATTGYLSTSYTYVGQFPRGLETARSLEPYVYSKGCLAQAAVCVGSVTPLFWMGRIDEAAEAAGRALDILARHPNAGDPHDRDNAVAAMWTMRVWCDLERGYAGDSELANRLAARAEDSGSVLWQAWWMQIRVQRAVFKGRIDEVRACWEELARLPPIAQVDVIYQSTKRCVARGLMEAGQVGEAIDVADGIIEDARRAGNPAVGARALLVRGLCLREWGHLEEAARCCERALALVLAPSCMSENTADYVRIGLAEIDFDRGLLDRAEALARAAHDRTARSVRKNTLIRLRARRLLGRIAHARGRSAAAHADLAWASERAGDLALPIEIGYSAHYLAEVCRAAGETDAAESHAEACRLALRGIDNFYLLRRLGYAESATPAPEPLRASSASDATTRQALAQTLSDGSGPFDGTTVRVRPGETAAETADALRPAAGEKQQPSRDGADLAETVDGSTDSAAARSRDG